MIFPSVSIIVPNYNHAPYLRQRLDSIFNQTYQNFEVIILDDCSTDNSKAIIDEYRNRPQISHIVYNETNSGSPFKQWTKGFDLAKGEYIWIAESDDWAEPFFLEELISKAVLFPDSALLFCSSIWEYTSSSVNKPLTNADFKLNGESFIRQWMLYNNFISNASAVIFKKDILHNIKPLYQNFSASGDYMFWILICEHGQIFYTSKTLNHFRQHNTSTTAVCKKNGIQFKENHSIFKYLVQKNYIHFLEKQKIILYYLNLIDDSKKFITTQTYDECTKLWEADFFVPFGISYLKKLKKIVDYIKA